MMYIISENTSKVFKNDIIPLIKNIGFRSHEIQICSNHINSKTWHLKSFHYVWISQTHSSISKEQNFCIF